MNTAMIGMITSRIPVSGTSWRSAMITPPMVRIGALIIMFRPIRTSVWTCGHVVGVAGDQAGRAEVVDLDLAEGLDLAEDPGPDVAPEAHGDPRAPVDPDDLGDHQRERDREHEAAGPQDVVRVALGDAVVDDVGVELGQVQVGDRLDEQQSEDEDDRRLVRREVGAQEADHAGASWIGRGGSLRGLRSGARGRRASRERPRGSRRARRRSGRRAAGRCARGAGRRGRPISRRPSSVRPTRTTRRSSSSRWRSTRSRCSMRSTIPVALAWLTSIASASAPMGRGPSASRVISTLRCTRLSRPPGQWRMCRSASLGPPPESSSTSSEMRVVRSGRSTVLRDG